MACSQPPVPQCFHSRLGNEKEYEVEMNVTDKLLRLKRKSTQSKHDGWIPCSSPSADDNESDQSADEAEQGPPTGDSIMEDDADNGEKGFGGHGDGFDSDLEYESDDGEEENSVTNIQASSGAPRRKRPEKVCD